MGVGVRGGDGGGGDPVPDVSRIMHEAVARRVFPGGVVACGKLDTGPAFYARGYGSYTYESSIPTTTESIWDVASLTKVLATTPAVMLLHDQGLLGLEDTVASHWPAFAQNGKGGVTVRQLLAHTAGLREWFPFYRLGKRNKDAIVDHICAEPLSYASGTLKYSDLGMIMLGCIVEKLAGVPLDTFVEERLFWPLGMTASRFRRVEELHWDRAIVPTSVDPGFRGRLLWGEVHDENAFLLGGVAGHAGLFSTASDIFRFVRMVLNGGRCPETGQTFFRPATLQLFTSADALSKARRGLGWDLHSRYGVGNSSAGTRMGPRTFGHTGFTGCSLWMDPATTKYVILLTNAVHPHEMSETGGEIQSVRPAVADAALLALDEGRLAEACKETARAVHSARPPAARGRHPEAPSDAVPGGATSNAVPDAPGPSPPLASTSSTLARAQRSTGQEPGNSNLKRVRAVGLLAAMILWSASAGP